MPRIFPCFLQVLVVLWANAFSLTGGVCAEPAPANTEVGDAMLKAYFEAETARLEQACLEEVRTLDDWTARKEELRRQLLEMLGLDPLPDRGDLAAQITGVTEHEAVRVERLHFQSSPGLYVTGNLYLPKSHDKPLPAVLYVCGHGPVKVGDVSFGNKVTYRHHGAWFARHGFACLTIDSLQLGEIEGIHHGTHRYDRWWWLSRGYTPAGVEAWNCLRAIDYLQSRPDIDGQRIGVTGRSGGGAYSWWIAAIDERIQAAVPVAGITDLRNHVVDGCVEGHCDCMYMLNTYQWDYPLVAALVAPRPLLISNTDDDGIFPLDGVVRTYQKVRRIYELHGARDKLGLSIGPGPHKDTQDLQIAAFRWLMRHLQGAETPVAAPAEKFFQPDQLKVFSSLPQDEVNTQIDRSFVPAASPPSPPADADEWRTQSEAWRLALATKAFRAWPQSPGPLDAEIAFAAEREGLRLEAFDFTSQPGIRLRLFLARRADVEAPDSIVLHALDGEGWRPFLDALGPLFAAELEYRADPSLARDPKALQLLESVRSAPGAVAFVAPRGVGPTAWDPSEKKQVQNRRRFYLLGQTWEGMQVFDLVRAVQAVQERPALHNIPLTLRGHGGMAAVSLYAALFTTNLNSVELSQLAYTHDFAAPAGQIPLLNVRRFLDVPQAVAMAAEKCSVVVHDNNAEHWRYPLDVAAALQWKPSQFSVRPLPETETPPAQ